MARRADWKQDQRLAVNSIGQCRNRVLEMADASPGRRRRERLNSSQLLANVLPRGLLKRRQKSKYATSVTVQNELPVTLIAEQRQRECASAMLARCLVELHLVPSGGHNAQPRPQP